MKKNLLKVICTVGILALLFIPTSAMAQSSKQLPEKMPLLYDFDPLVNNITVTVTIKEIRALKTIDLLSNPDFYVKVKINDKEFISNVWENMKYVENPGFSATAGPVISTNSGTSSSCSPFSSAIRLRK